MDKMKRVLAVFLLAAMLTVSGTNNIQAKKAELVIVLDAGHGGYDSGAAANGLYEKMLTLKIAQYCKAELEKYQGVKVYMTRTNDTYVGLDQRVSIAAGVKADLFVSLHINSAGNSSASGAEVFYPNSNYRPSVGAKGRKAASAIQKNLTALGLRNRGLKTLNSMIGSSYPDGSAADYYAVIRGAKKAGFPGIIVEHAFISNFTDAKMFLSTSAMLKKLGVADAKGIASCYGLKRAEETKETLSKTSINRLVGKSSEQVLLGWNKVKGAEGYEIYRSTSKNGVYTRTASVKKSGTVTWRDKNVVSGKTYYYKVRPYKMSGAKKITAPFCAAQKVKLLKKPAVSIKKQSQARAKVSWKEVKGAVKYEVYRSTSKKGKYQKMATVQKESFFKDTNRRVNKNYYYKVRAVGNGIKGSTYSSYSEIK